jgi:hypothetical protein
MSKSFAGVYFFLIGFYYLGVSDSALGRAAVGQVEVQTPAAYGETESNRLPWCRQSGKGKLPTKSQGTILSSKLSFGLPTIVSKKSRNTITGGFWC